LQVEKRENLVDCASETSYKSKAEAQKKLVEQLKLEWKSMWSERFHDKQKAEGVSVADYEQLRVNRGTVIHATRDFKALNFKDILSEHLVENPDLYIQPSSTEGGWNKFVKTNIKGQKKDDVKRRETFAPKKARGSQPKNGGRGWLHKS
jgi:hypothetical protein